MHVRGAKDVRDHCHGSQRPPEFRQMHKLFGPQAPREGPRHHRHEDGNKEGQAKEDFSVRLHNLYFRCKICHNGPEFDLKSDLLDYFEIHKRLDKQLKRAEYE